MAFAQIYICPTHGEVDGTVVEDIDTENDEVYEWMACAKCFRNVKPLLTAEGKSVMRPLTEEEMYFDNWDAED